MDASISDYALIGDGRSAALVSRSGSIDWLCWPRFDSGSLFGRLLDPEGGAFSLRPEAHLPAQRRYVGDTNVLVTRWEDGARALQVMDWMPISRPGRDSKQWPEHSLVRVAHCERGELELRVQFDPRPEYGTERPRRTDASPHRVRLETKRGLITLHSSRPLSFGAEGVARVRLQAGESLDLVLTWSTEAPAVLVEPDQFAGETLGETLKAWREWAARVRYQGPWRDQVLRSALALKLLIYAPSGAVIAAPTTSLPERIGGALNWDYRFSWVRDAALTVRALYSLQLPEEAESYVSWLLHSTRLTRPRMGVLYDVFGRMPPEELTLGHWRGYRESRPVRINNGAAEQLQFDAYGEVIDAFAQLVRKGHSFDRETSSMLRDFGEFVCRRWEEPDAGIWEIRGPRRHHTFSRAMCWVALTRLLEMHDRGAVRARFPVDRFRMNVALLFEEIQTRGFNTRIGSYVETLDGTEVDASLVLLSWYGFSSASSARMKATGDRVRARLSPAPGLIYRNEQFRRMNEGTFCICNFWFAEFLARGCGTLGEAESFFRAAASYANDVGLFAEEIDPATGAALGNFPQAFSHTGLISAAVAIEERRGEPWAQSGVTP